MLAITINALYTTLRKRGTTRQLAGAIVICVLSALLLLPAIVWYNVRFSSELPTLLVGAMLVYVAVWGWLVPLGATTIYCLFTQPRSSNTSVHIPRQRKQHTTRGNAAAPTILPPQRQPGVPAPFVFGEDIPWGWLEYRGGRFQGQRLALKRMVVTIGREEDNEVWLDDDTASRYHAELAWDQGQVYVTDCDSLNGVVLNGRRIRGTMPVGQGDLIEIGAHHFVFEKAELAAALAEQFDPLMRHIGGSIVRRSSSVVLEDGADQSALGTINRPLQVSDAALPTTPPPATPAPASLQINADISEAQTNPLPPVPVPPLSRPISGPVPLRLPSKPKD